MSEDRMVIDAHFQTSQSAVLGRMLVGVAWLYTHTYA